MQRFATNAQICFGLVSITISLLLLLNLCGQIPQRGEAEAAARVAVLRTVATNAMLALQREDLDLARQILQSVLTMVPGVRGGELWLPPYHIAVGEIATDSLIVVTVPIFLDGRPLGEIDFFSVPAPPPTLRSLLESPFTRIVLVIGIGQLIAYWVYIGRVFEDLNLFRVVPSAIARQLNLLAEGLVVMDRDQRIVLANRAFAQAVGQEPGNLLDTRLDSIAWSESPLNPLSELPWDRALQHAEPSLGSTLRLQRRHGHHSAYRVNVVPLVDEGNRPRGAMASFDDVTGLEQRTVVLTRMLARLKASRDQIRHQNQQLHRLATRDPLTSALNRWSFFEHFEGIWAKRGPHELPTSCLLIDVDHFKKINDTYGHAKGDFVLKRVVEVLQSLSREPELVCRYGGEEFCVVLPQTAEDEASRRAEEIRMSIRRADFQGMAVTASFGVASSSSGAESTQQLMDQADQALYAAKRDGRNRVVRYSQLSLLDAHTVRRHPAREAAPTTETAISCQIVAALTSALAYRDAATAEHSRRVADLCVRLARDLMPLSACYVLENAALLHDVGKIGVPDSILLKPGPLAENEWSIMRSHDQMGVDIIRSTFACEQLTDIVMYHPLRFDGVGAALHVPVGADIPVGARILAIADAYDAMVTDRVFRAGLGIEEAFAELRRCAGTQFDPELVERFIVLIRDTAPPQGIDTSHVSKPAALRLGVQIENLARAIDAEDIAALRDLTCVVRETAQEFQIPQVETLANSLMAAIEAQHEWMATVRLTLDLMEICRQTQRSHLATLGPSLSPRGRG